ncbi:MAG: hypothetical protein ACTSPB_24305, partial [Candidatus Thorarchaeota archaeon]
MEDRTKDQTKKIMGCQLENMHNECDTCVYQDHPDICEGIRRVNSWKVYYGDEIPIIKEDNMSITIEDHIKKILYDTKRSGVSELVNHLEHETDFFEAPASTKHHLAQEGGLAEHSLSVYQTMVKMNDAFELCIPLHHIVITGLLHDLCKTNYYIEWQTQEVTSFGGVNYSIGWKVNDQLPLGHGEKSLYLVSKYLTLSDAEAAAIRWHMGCWTAGVTTD